jgi:ornithine carbamoyltransferase
MNTNFVAKPLTTCDLLTVAELSREDIETLLATASTLKGHLVHYRGLLAGKTLAMLFEKPSLRTRVSFEVGFAKLGGHVLYIDQQSAKIGQRESVSDCAKNLERFTDVLVARTFSHDTVQELADAASIPVINALSDRFHPCQALADVLTLAELFPFRGWNGMSLAYIGDGNNVCHSLMLACAVLGVHMTVITPAGYEPCPDVVSEATASAVGSGAQIIITNDLDAVRDHQVVYTDTWVSMGSESEEAARLGAFEPYQVTPEIMDLAGAKSRFMHCLPAHRGQEVTVDVIDSPRSVVFDQAENRMHAQNALLVHLLADENRASVRAPMWPDVVGAAV